MEDHLHSSLTLSVKKIKRRSTIIPRRPSNVYKASDQSPDRTHVRKISLRKSISAHDPLMSIRSNKKPKMPCPITPHRLVSKRKITAEADGLTTFNMNNNPSTKKPKLLPVKNTIAMPSEDWRTNPFSIPLGEKVNIERRRSCNFKPVRPTGVLLLTAKKSEKKSIPRPRRLDTFKEPGSSATAKKALAFDETTTAVNVRNFETPAMVDSPCQQIPSILSKQLNQPENMEQEVEQRQPWPRNRLNVRRSLRLAHNKQTEKELVTTNNFNKSFRPNNRRQTIFNPNLDELDDEITGIRKITFDADNDNTVISNMTENDERRNTFAANKQYVSYPVPPPRSSRPPLTRGYETSFNNDDRKKLQEASNPRKSVSTKDRFLRSVSKQAHNFSQITEESESQDEQDGNIRVITPTNNKRKSKTSQAYRRNCESTTPKHQGRRSTRRSVLVQQDGSPLLVAPNPSLDRDSSDDSSLLRNANKKSNIYLEGSGKSHSSQQLEGKYRETRNSAVSKTTDKKLVIPTLNEGPSSQYVEKINPPRICVNGNEDRVNESDSLIETRRLISNLNEILLKTDWSVLRNSELLQLTDELKKHELVVNQAQLRLKEREEIVETTVGLYSKAREDILAKAKEIRERTSSSLKVRNTQAERNNDNPFPSISNDLKYCKDETMRGKRKSLSGEKLDFLKNDHRFLKTPRRVVRRSSISTAGRAAVTSLKQDLESQLAILYDQD
ncbi:uncharacterized protein LOC136031222 [Artemia franciscana]|uniref:Uncharacterized protein n=2 Tax=Artemia franciscana TaxID=6661 RepID=A0AA88HCQ0_ARTSF|nr:hypothetical protein QYM36_016870 [Artemia franciscana]